ncbi:MAG: glycosyltransferase [Butyrivibrio sp.]|nr:glycosyltransferase [Butyrivibrio sp.]
MIYVVFDNTSAIGHLSECAEEAGQPTEVMTIKKGKLPKLIRQVLLCWECAGKAKTGDTIMCWFDFMAVLCWWMCPGPKRSKVRFIAINVLLKKKSSLKNLIYRMLYSRAFRNENFIATITARDYGDYLNSILKVDRDYTLLHDSYKEKHWMYKEELPPIIPNSVFCGGLNGRDWDFLLKLVKAMPEVTYVLVVSGEIRDKIELFIKDYNIKNIQLYSNIPHSKFATLLCSSELVVMPLDSEAPSGLLVFFEAAANKKMIITSDTASTREYFSSGRGELCSKNEQEWIDMINYYLNNKEKRDACNSKCRDFLNTECSQKKYREVVIGLLQ